MKSDDEGSATPAADPPPQHNEAEAARGAGEGGDHSLSSVASLRDRIAVLTAERERLEALNAAIVRENDALNVALLELSLEKRREQAAAKQEVSDAEAPVEPSDSFAGPAEAAAFECPLGAGVARVALSRSDERRRLGTRLVLPWAAIDPDAEGDIEAVCEVGLDPAERAGGEALDWGWTGRRRAAVSQALLDVAAAMERALADAADAPPANAELWAANAAYLAAVGHRTRSPSMDGALIGPMALSGVGPMEATETGEARWTTAATSAFALFATRKGRLAISIAARSLAGGQSLTLRLDGAEQLDVDFPFGEATIAQTFEVLLDWGVHVLEIEAPAFEREQGGDFRNLHVLLERFETRWRELDETEEPEAELFGWAPPLYAAQAAS